LEYINGYRQPGKVIGDVVEKLQWTYVKFIIEETKTPEQQYSEVA